MGNRDKRDDKIKKPKKSSKQLGTSAVLSQPIVEVVKKRRKETPRDDA